ncbi:hypothetical protein HYC85_000556 [Camellia sinensis]|uniref:Nucleoside phosphorylase domain-containing protein n=1 Tax=Camellia sinensis TaxID=4442 RepID=A0A7J7I3Y5_CAMSI|nr:hypothetical protein HYC85_000556 [Camellia sinensis]
MKDKANLADVLNERNDIGSITSGCRGRRFRVGKVRGKSVIYVRWGIGLVNAAAAAAAQQMLDVFKIIRVVHFRIAGNANNSKSIGDVTIPKQYFNCGLWDWLLDDCGKKPNGTLGTSDKAHLEFGNYNLPKGEAKGEGEVNNELGRMGYSTEQFFSESGKPNNPQSLLWAEINFNLLKFASNLEESPNAKSISLYCVGMELEQCLNSSECLPKKPKLVLGLKGSTPNTCVDNAACRAFLFKTFHLLIWRAQL